MSDPETRYARSGDVSIAYQVVGDGPVDLVWQFDFFGNVDVQWESPFMTQLKGVPETWRLYQAVG